jgi:hypothetical protein
MFDNTNHRIYGESN